MFKVGDIVTYSVNDNTSFGIIVKIYVNSTGYPNNSDLYDIKWIRNENKTLLSGICEGYHAKSLKKVD